MDWLKKNWISVLLLSGIMFFVLVNSSQAVYSNQYSKLRWWTKEIKQNDNLTKINITYPYFIGGSEIKGLNEYIANIFKKMIAEKKSEYSDCPNSKYIDADNVFVECGVRINSKYKVASIINDIVSIEFTIADFSGGGNWHHEEPIIVNYDLKANRLLDGKELFCKFPPPNLSDILYEELKEKHFEQVMDTYAEEVKAESKSEWNLKSIVLGYKGFSIVFTTDFFDRMGIIRISIPYKDERLKDVFCLP